MGANTKIEWADHTFNPWIGCTKVSPGCDHCYAEALASRYGWAKWGNFPRKRTSEANWRQPLAWDRAAARAGARPFVFCSSLADVFDNQVEPSWRADLFALIDATPNLVWLLLTKRPQNILKLWPARSLAPPNVALGCSIVNQDEADRNFPALLAAGLELRTHTFASCEPLLGPINLHSACCRETGSCGTCLGCFGWLDWLIAGGESGPHARPMHPQWARDLRDQCRKLGTPFFFKQWGEFAPATSEDVDLVIARNGVVDRCLPSEMAGGGDKPLWCAMKRVGKKAAGRVFDGVEHLARFEPRNLKRRKAA